MNDDQDQSALWATTKVAIRNIAALPTVPAKERTELVALADVIGKGELPQIISGYLEYVKTQTNSESIRLRESASLINRIDEDYFDRSEPLTFADPVDLFKSKPSDPKVQASMRAWVKDLPRQVRRIRREAHMLSEWKVPDYPGAVAELVSRVLNQGPFISIDREQAISAELKTLVTHVIQGRVSLSVLQRPDRVLISVPLGVAAYPDVMSGDQACDYLLERHEKLVSESKLKALARQAGRGHLKPEGGTGYLRSTLDEGAAAGWFDDGRRAAKGPADDVDD